MWRLNRDLKSSIPHFPEKSKLPGSWDCSVFSPKKTVIKILGFLFPVREFVCNSCWLLPAALFLPVSLPCCLHWADLWSEFLFQRLLFLRGLHFPCWDLSPKSLVCSASMTSLLCSYFSLPCTFVDSCSLTALLLFAAFIFCLCTAEPRTQLCFTELGRVQAADPGALLQLLPLGRKARQCRAAPVLGQPRDGPSRAIGSAGISYSTLWV